MSEAWRSTNESFRQEMTKNTQEMQLNFQNRFDTVTRSCKSLIDIEAKNIFQSVTDVKNSFTESFATKKQEVCFFCLFFKLRCKKIRF